MAAVKPTVKKPQKAKPITTTKISSSPMAPPKKAIRTAEELKSPMPVVKNLVSTDFEVFGKVQGVFFRRHTLKKATELGLKGWVQNSPKGTVIGQIQGPLESVINMKSWLQSVGSPKSKIEKTEFMNEGWINSLSFKTFKIRK